MCVCSQHSGTPVGHTAGDRCSLIFVVGYLKHLVISSSTVQMKTLNESLQQNLLWQYQKEEEIFCWFSLAWLTLCVSAAFAQQRSATVIRMKPTPHLPALSLNGLSHLKEVHPGFVGQLPVKWWVHRQHLISVDRLIQLWKSRTDDIEIIKIKSYACPLYMTKFKENLKK